MGALTALISRVIPNIHGAYARHLFGISLGLGLRQSPP